MSARKIFTGLVSTAGQNLSDEKYHGDTTRVSASMLKTCWSKTPAHVYAQHIDPDREVSEIQKAQFAFGQMFHAATLEPEEFDNRFVVLPEGIDYRSKDGKSLKSDIESAGKTPIKYDAWTASQKMMRKLLAHPFFKKHEPKRALKEIAILGDGVRCKPDLLFIYGTHAICVDLKTCADASPYVFERSAYRMGYHIQAAWYSDMVSELYGVPCDFVFGCAEKSVAYIPAFYRASDEMIGLGRKHYMQAWKIIEDCMQSGVWPGYGGEVMELDAPAWAYEADTDDSLVFGDGTEIEAE